ncbi:Rieske (2Fe-2S) protein [Sphingobacterium sp. LRF_L2]|uniref:Rieske (2Fe-2S) protein n=1 Tax=Sphingobacterium sp. LRF_L2 TaxID=3369421 RepID=UPI003F627A5A
MGALAWFLISIPEKEGVPLRLRVGNTTIAIILREGKLHAYSVRCPHAGADLTKGWCDEEGMLVCPYHRHRFDLETGKGAPGQGNYIAIYPLKEKDGKWYVGLRKSFWKRIFSS